MRVLIISEYIAPAPGVGSLRWTKIGKYLAQQGCSVDILTDEKVFDVAHPLFAYDCSQRMALEPDETTIEDLAFFNDYIRSRPSLITRGLNLVKNLLTLRAVSKPAKSLPAPPSAPKGDELALDTKSTSETALVRTTKNEITTASVSSLERWAWVLRNRCAAQDAWRTIRTRIADYDVIISSYGPSWPHQVAARLKRDNPNLMWVADFRDAPACYTSKESDNDRLQRGLTSEANIVLGVTDGVVEQLGFAGGRRFMTAPNGFDPAERASRVRQRSSEFEVVYTGRLYPGDPVYERTLIPIAWALETLQRQGRIELGRVRMVYAGPDSAEFAAQMASTPSVQTLDCGLLSRDEALALQERASVLVLCTVNSRQAQGIATGKIYEYIASGVPIAGSVTGDVPASLCRQVLEDSNAGFAFEEARFEKDWPELLHFIDRLYQQWLECGETSYELNENAIEPFDYERIAARLIEALKTNGSSEFTQDSESPEVFRS